MAVRSSLNIPIDVQKLLWRIFGVLSSPMKDVTAFNLIEREVETHTQLSEEQLKRCVAEIRSWFESYDDEHWIIASMQESVANAIIEGLNADFSSDRKIWAVAYLDFETMLPLLRTNWSKEAIRDFSERALAVIKLANEREKLFDPARVSSYIGVDSDLVTIPLEAIECESRLATFNHLGQQRWELVHVMLNQAVSRLVKLLISLDPDSFEILIDELDHPVLQALAAEHFLTYVHPRDDRVPLQWIHPESSVSVLALAIYHTLRSINELNNENTPQRIDLTLSQSRGDPCLGEEDLSSAPRDLSEGLIDRVLALPIEKSARWLGELISITPEILDSNHQQIKPQRVKDVEATCIKQFALRLDDTRHGKVIEAFQAGLSLTRRITWTRHVADLAWTMHENSSGSAQELAQLSLDCHERIVAQKSAENEFFIHWEDWHYRDWLDALGRALLLAESPKSANHFTNYVRSFCDKLPVTIWDAEDRYPTFVTADRVVQHWLLIGTYAVQYACDTGQSVDPNDVRELCDLTHDHCNFAVGHGIKDADCSVAVEMAARMAVEYGEVQETWLIERAKSKFYSSRTLWAFADQYISTRHHKASKSKTERTDFMQNFGQIAALRFGDARQYSLESLNYWALFWLRVKVHEPCEETATALVAAIARQKRQSRAIDILVLKLLSLSTVGGQFAKELEHLFREVYRRLWLSYTPHSESDDRAEVDDYLRESRSPLLDISQART